MNGQAPAVPQSRPAPTGSTGPVVPMLGGNADGSGQPLAVPRGRGLVAEADPGLCPHRQPGQSRNLGQQCGLRQHQHRLRQQQHQRGHPGRRVAPAR